MSGTSAERELSNILEDDCGFAAMRAPAWGGRPPRARPDVVAGKRIESGAPGAAPTRHLVFEVKKRTSDWPQNVYIDGDELRELQDYAERFGGTPYLAVRPNRRRSKQDWHFVPATDRRLGRTDSGTWVIRREDLPALSLAEVISGD
jgi:Holliday junction resolvase